MKAEKIFTVTRAVEGAVRASSGEDGKAVLSGLGMVFNKWSRDWVWSDWKGREVRMRERIDPKAVEGLDLSDVRSYMNHVPPVLGRTGAKTMRIAKTSEGLAYEVDLADTTHAKDVQRMVERGDVYSSSWRGDIVDMVVDTKETDTSVTIERTVTKIENLVEMGPVDDPRYKEATAEVQREFEKYVTNELETLKLRLRLTKLGQ